MKRLKQYRLKGYNIHREAKTADHEIEIEYITNQKTFCYEKT